MNHTVWGLLNSLEQIVFCEQKTEPAAAETIKVLYNHRTVIHSQAQFTKMLYLWHMMIYK